jgi:hypothetical protein
VQQQQQQQVNNSHVLHATMQQLTWT